MSDVLYFIQWHRYFSAAMLILNLVIARQMAVKIDIHTNRRAMEAAGRRNEKQSLYSRYSGYFKRSLEKYDKREKRAGIYLKAKDKMKKAGYRGEFAAYIYLLLKYALPLVLLLISTIIDVSNFMTSLILCLCLSGSLEIVVYSRKRDLNLRFKRHAYKIYKYLHNQISSGVSITDALKTVHEAVDDKELKEILIRLSASYALTLDIDASLEEFKTNFTTKDARTLCVVLRQGVATGENKELLTKQERKMFKMYLNYLQSETDNCKFKSFMAAVMFTAIIAIMILVPMLGDLTESLINIFIS